MKILFLDSKGEGLAFLAQSLLQQYDRYMLISSASVLPNQGVRDIIQRCISGLNLKEKARFVPVSEFLNEPWDYVVTLTEEAKLNYPVFNGRVKLHIRLPLEALINEKDRDFTCARLNEEIKKQLYIFYQHHILEPEEERRCPCGANRYCRCF